MDVMHDIFEGSASYTMSHICYSIIYEQKLFDLDTLNKRIELFNSEKIGLSNKIPQLTKVLVSIQKKI